MAADDNKTVHPSITVKRLERAVESQMFSLENPGFCLACGADADGCEPDASGYHCDECGEDKVEGAENCMFLVF